MTSNDSINVWSECIRQVKFWRNEVKRSFGEPINHLEIVENMDGEVSLYGLANTCNENATSQQTLVVANLPKVANETESLSIPPLLKMKTMFDLSNLGNRCSEKPSAELCLFYERLRGQMVSGISSYSIHPSNELFLLTSGSQLHCFKNQNLLPIATYSKSAALNATFSPIDHRFVAFSCKSQLYIDKQNEQIFVSESSPNTTNGVASFVAQEEFERFDGFWWSPTRLELLYERVDESKVTKLTFLTPGRQLDDDSILRYPIAGGNNPVSQLRICHINVDSNDLVLDMELQVDIKKIVPWYEYLVRCGWTPNGENVYMYVMNREQNHAALLLVPRIVFCNDLVEDAERLVIILYEEELDSWVNCTNLIHFLPDENNGYLRAILGTERYNLCHLYLHNFEITHEESPKLDEIAEDCVISEFSSVSLPTQIIASEKNISGISVADPLIAARPPPIQVISSDEVVENNAEITDPLKLQKSERRPSITLTRLSHQVGILVGASAFPITDINSNWAVIKEAALTVDHERQHVYYLCNKVSPAIFSLAVSSYDSLSMECCLLTPTDLCYKFERAQPSITVNPNVGFVCWLSNVHQLPECRFYHLIHNKFSSLDLPGAVYAYRIGLHLTGANPLTSLIPVKCNEADVSELVNLSKTTETPSGVDSENTIAANAGQATLYRAPKELFHAKIFSYPSVNSNQVHYALLMWPTERCSGGGKFTVIHSVYAGPSVQLVKDNWHSVAHHLKYISMGYAVLMVDGRGSANRGLQFEAHIKYRLGSVELQDQVEGLKEVVRQTDDLLDLSRVGVIGWSYGGYMSLLLLANFPHIYSAACVGGAVSDWVLYDTAYTERYMGLPQDHETDYHASSVVSQLDKLPDEAGRLLIVHGMLDENVHFSHTERLINGLIHAGKPHQLLLLPNERHSMRKGETIEYFHSTVLTFFVKAFS